MNPIFIFTPEKGFQNTGEIPFSAIRNGFKLDHLWLAKQYILVSQLVPQVGPGYCSKEEKFTPYHITKTSLAHPSYYKKKMSVHTQLHTHTNTHIRDYQYTSPTLCFCSFLQTKMKTTNSIMPYYCFPWPVYFKQHFCVSLMKAYSERILVISVVAPSPA